MYAGKGQGKWVIADGCALPFGDKAFDVVYSNSIIEHLGILEKQREFAYECQRVGIRFYVQTPDKWFFMEPHLITPFIHWLPRKWQRHLLRRFTVWGWITKPTQEQCEDSINEVRLLTSAEMIQFFPNSVMQNERFFGLTKSLIATR